jgi:hypothetical protein
MPSCVQARGASKRCVTLLALLFSACGGSAPVSDLTIAPDVISPNADGVADIARVSYRVSQNSIVSIYLLAVDGTRHDVRRDVVRPAIPDSYTLLFNGMDADGKLLPNGAYTLVVEHGAARLSRAITIEKADSAQPKITELTVDPIDAVFTPNRDAIDDHVYINIGIAKQAKLTVYVLGADNFRQNIPREELARTDNTSEYLEPGRYYFDYDGGIDKGADPPPDGLYTLVAEAVDSIGQRDVMTRPLTIRDSGRPVAEIVPQPSRPSIDWRGAGANSEVTLKLGDTLYFTATVSNYGTSPIRTEGPFDPEACYTLDENRYTKGYAEADGAWRFGVDFQTNTGEDHPFRWGIGSLDDLDVVERDGQKLYYLAPGKQVLVRGCVVLNRVPVRNPFNMWGSLIHENVEIASVNSRVSPIRVTVVKP